MPFHCFIKFQIIQLPFIKKNHFKNKKKEVKNFTKKKSIQVNSNLKEKEVIRKETTEKFLSWLLYNNVYIFNKSTWGRPPHQCFVSNETTDEGEPCGRGLLAFKKIQQGEKIIEIPENVILKTDTILLKLENIKQLNEYDILAISIIQQQAMGDKSRWKIYFNVLPEENDLNLFFRWNIFDTIFLKRSKVLRASLYLKEKIRIQFSRIEKEIFQKDRLQFPTSIFNAESWEWAVSLLLSRAIFLQTVKKVALVPYADFINHNPFSGSYIDGKKIAFSNNYDIVMYADKDYNKYDQVFTTYGPKTNLELLVLYGFILERNPFDSVELRIALSTRDKIFEKKKKFIQECEKSEQITFPVFYYKYPKELYEFIRFCLANYNDFKNQDISDFDFNQEYDFLMENLIRKIVIFCCEKIIKNYSKILDEDSFLESIEQKILISKNQKIAIKQRKCEKKILQRLSNNLQKDIKI